MRLPVLSFSVIDRHIRTASTGTPAVDQQARRPLAEQVFEGMA